MIHKETKTCKRKEDTNEDIWAQHNGKLEGA